MQVKAFERYIPLVVFVFISPALCSICQRISKEYPKILNITQ